MPGDIFSTQTSDGRLQLLDQDEPSNLGPDLSDIDLPLVVVFESMFWREGGKYECLKTYSRNKLNALHGSYYGRLVLAAILHVLVDDSIWFTDPEDDFRDTMSLSFTLESIKIWTDSLLRNRQLINLLPMAGRWLVGKSTIDAPPTTGESRLFWLGVDSNRVSRTVNHIFSRTHFGRLIARIVLKSKLRRL